MRTVLGKLAALVLPEACALCDTVCSSGFCQACEDLLTRVPEPCQRCALPRTSNVRHRCAPIAGAESLIAPFIFEAPLSDTIHAFKYRRQRSLGRALALALLRATGAGIPATDALIPVPLHPARLRERTFNQADQIAATLAAQTGIPLLATAARRVAATPPQAQLAPARRAENLRNAFVGTGKLQGLRVTIVDDVVTTGATAAALARALLAADAKRVSVWAVARTLPAAPGPSQPDAGGKPLRKI